MATIRHLGSREDEAAIGEVLLQLAKGYALKDAELVAAAYAEDADWSWADAGGGSVRCSGRLQILEALRERFAHSPQASDAGRDLPVRPRLRITFVGPDAAWVRSTHGVHRLQVLTRSEGHWRIVAELGTPA